MFRPNGAKNEERNRCAVVKITLRKHTSTHILFIVLSVSYLKPWLSVRKSAISNQQSILSALCTNWPSFISRGSQVSLISARHSSVNSLSSGISSFPSGESCQKCQALWFKWKSCTDEVWQTVTDLKFVFYKSDVALWNCGGTKCQYLHNVALTVTAY